MTARHLFALSILALLVGAGPVSAQEDDDQLPSLAPKEKPAKPSRRKHKPAPRPPPGDESDEALPRLGPTRASLSVNLTTPGLGARLFIDGAEVGPLMPGDPPHPVSPGSHKVMVRRPGFKDFNLTVSTRAGAVAQVPVSLEPAPGTLAVQSDVPHSDVWVDGRRLGEAPLEGVELPPGDHEIQVRREGYETDTSRLSIRAGKEYHVLARLKPQLSAGMAAADRPERLNLTPSGSVGATSPGPLSGSPTVAGTVGTPWYGQWYVWAGVAAVAAASAVGVVVATQPHALDPNKDVCRPQCSTIVNDPRPGAAALLRF